jgi:hypothetical protein
MNSSDPTELIVIGTLHGRHNTAKRYTPEALRQILLALRPPAHKPTQWAQLYPPEAGPETLLSAPDLSASQVSCVDQATSRAADRRLRFAVSPARPLPSACSPRLPVSPLKPRHQSRQHLSQPLKFLSPCRMHSIVHQASSFAELEQCNTFVHRTPRHGEELLGVGFVEATVSFSDVEWDGDRSAGQLIRKHPMARPKALDQSRNGVSQVN